MTGYRTIVGKTRMSWRGKQIDPSTGAFIGNFPQAFSHIGIIASGVTLARSTGATGGQASTAGASA